MLGKLVGGITKALNPAGLLGGMAGQLLGGQGGGLGGILGGIAKFAAGGFNPMNMAMQAFQGLMGGQNPLSSLMGGGAQGTNMGSFPQMPSPVNTTGNLNTGIMGPQQGAMNQLANLQNNIANTDVAGLNKNPAGMLQLQENMQKMQQMFETMSKISKKLHDITMSILRNI
ncbi:MAG: hypothetical protein H6728_15775 [Myxococcales bacterium]|nr:hypothetical protein [Myxococcales bacterium]MCB9644532.1 hypothetical protein [Myxococcales bacterium]